MSRMIHTSLFASLLFAAASMAQNAPATAPSGSTGLCKDGSYWTGASKKGACRGHKGVKDWYAASTAAASAAAATTAATPAAAAPAAPAPVAAAHAKAATAAAAAAAPGGGPGLVWANKSSRVYHCSTDRYYGKTRNGEYLSEADAKAQGFRAGPRQGVPVTIRLRRTMGV